MNYQIKTKEFMHQIQFIENLSKSDVQDAQWVCKYLAYASVKSLYENSHALLEGLKFGHVMSENLFLFRMRFVFGVTTKMRIAFGAKQYEIKKLVNLGHKNRILQIIALEI